MIVSKARESGGRNGLLLVLAQVFVPPMPSRAANDHHCNNCNKLVEHQNGLAEERVPMWPIKRILISLDDLHGDLHGDLHSRAFQIE